MKAEKKSVRFARLRKVLRVSLSALFFAQAAALYLARTEVPLPDFVCGALSEKLAPAGTRLTIGGASLHRLTFLKLRDVALAGASGAETLASARFVGAHFNWKNFAEPGKNAQTFFCDGVELRCPASRSQTGKPEIVLDRGSVEAALSFGEIRVREARARLAGVPVSASGTFPLTLLVAGGREDAAEDAIEDTEAERRERPLSPEGGGGSADSPPDGGNAAAAPEASPLAAFYAFAKALSEAGRRQKDFRELEGLSLRVEFGPADADGALAVSAELFCERLQRDELRLVLDEARASGEILFFPATREIVAETPLRASVKSARCRVGEGLFDAWTVAADGVRAEAEPARDVLGAPRSVRVAVEKIDASNFLHGDFSFAGTAAEARSADWKTAGALRLFTEIFGTEIDASVAHDAAAGTRVRADLLPDFPRLIRVPQIAAALPEDAKKFAFFERPRARVEADFAPDFSFREARWDVRSGPATWRMVRARAVRCEGSVTPEALNVALAQVSGENYCANARVFVEFGGEKKYRVSAFGSIANPEALDDYLGWFWWRIWKNLALAPAPHAPRADVDVHGTWDGSLRWEYVYGSIAGENALGGGVLVDKARLRVVEEPAFIAAFDMAFERGDDSVAGTLQWHYAFEPEYHYRDFRFAFTGTMPPGDVFRVVGEGLPEAFDGVLEREGAGTADVSGFFSGDERFYPEPRQLVVVDVRAAPGPFRFLGIEGADFRGRIAYDSGAVRVEPFSAKCGEDGGVSGGIFVRFPEEEIRAAGTRVELDLTLANVETARLRDVLKKFSEAEEKTPAAGGDGTAEKPADENADKPSEETLAESRIDATFRGGLTLPGIETLDASGHFSLRDPALYELHVFGGFSRFLQMVKVPFTSFAFTEATADYAVSGGKVMLPNLRIFGESGSIEADVEYALADGKIRGEAVFRNRRFTNIPLIGTVIDWASESTTLVPIELSGTLDDVGWKLRPFGNFLKKGDK
ncbi:MAG: hypothetical protein ACI4QA_07530 [Candidatus Spyradosoma sp.]